MMLEKRQRSHLFADFHRLWAYRIKKSGNNGDRRHISDPQRSYSLDFQTTYSGGEAA
jgi:hypothetical protein